MEEEKKEEQVTNTEVTNSNVEQTQNNELKVQQESKNKKTIKGKGLKAYIIVIIIIALAITYGCGFLLGKKLYEKENEPKESDKSVEEQNNNVEETQEEKKEEQKEEKNTTIKENNSQSEQIKKVENTHIYGKNENAKPNSDYPDVTYMPISVSRNGITAYINKDLKTATLKIDSQAYGSKLDKSIELNISFDREILEIFFGLFGQGEDGTTLLFLMKDGTIEYIPLYENLNGKDNNQISNIKSYGIIKGVSNVVALVQMEVETELSGYYSVGARLADGSFYDLSEFNLK